VAQFERGDEGQTEFCERRQLGLSSLQHWLYRLRREAREAKETGARFVPVVAKPAAASSSDGTAACKLRLVGAEVSFAELPPASYVAELLRLMDR
jgi:hypothetical protein